MVPLPPPLRRLPPFTLTAGTTREDERVAPPGGGVVRAERLDVRSGPACAGGPRARSGGRPRRAGGQEDVEPRRGHDALGLAGGVARGNEAPSASAVAALLRDAAVGGSVGRRRTSPKRSRASGRSHRGGPPVSVGFCLGHPILARPPRGRCALRRRACPASADASAREGPGAAHLRRLSPG